MLAAGRVGVMAEKCKETVWRPCIGRSTRCGTKAKRDGYCGTHHPDAVKRRQEKIDRRFKRFSAELDAKYKREAIDARAGARCRALGIAPEEIKA